MKVLDRTKTTATLAPTIRITDDTRLAEAVSKRDTLAARVDEVDQIRARLTAGLNTASARQVLNARAEAYLEDGLVPRPGDGGLAERRTDLEATVDELAVLRHALALQNELVERETRRVSQEICERVRPQYREIVRRLAAAIVALAAAAREERELREALVDAGVLFAGHLRPMLPPAAGTFDLHEPNSGASQWIGEAVEHGLLDRPYLTEKGKS